VCNWYSKLFLNVCWNSKLSACFSVGSGVCQDGCLSPVILTFFVNVFISQLRLQRLGCHISSLLIASILCADDILLLSPSVMFLQKTLDRCSELAVSVSLLSPWSLVLINVIVWLVEKGIMLKYPRAS